MAGRNASERGNSPADRLSGCDGDERRHSGSVLYMTRDLLLRHSTVSGGINGLETLRIDGLRRTDRIRTIENLSLAPALLNLELPCHFITSMAPVLVCSVSVPTLSVRIYSAYSYSCNTRGLAAAEGRTHTTNYREIHFVSNSPFETRRAGVHVALRCQMFQQILTCSICRWGHLASTRPILTTATAQQL